jgi:hypothetical protein
MIEFSSFPAFPAPAQMLWRAADVGYLNCIKIRRYVATL